ncbi:hypothetical protein [Streptomyces sp. NPDC001781]
MSPKNLPAPGRAGGLSDVLRARHSGATTPAAPALDPFAPQPVDPATVTGTAEERLKAFEAAIDRAKETAGTTLKSARARFVVEAGTALRAIRDEDGGLYKVTHATFEDYISARWDMDRSRAYQLIDAAPVMRVMSKIFDAAPVESHARVLAPVMEDHGEPAVREVVVAVRTTGEKVTAEAIREAVGRLGYARVPVQPTAADAEPLPVDHTAVQARALVRLEQGLAALKVAHRALRGRVIPDAVAADAAHGSELVAEVADLAGKISRLAE